MTGEAIGLSRPRLVDHRVELTVPGYYTMVPRSLSTVMVTLCFAIHILLPTTLVRPSPMVEVETRLIAQRTTAGRVQPACRSTVVSNGLLGLCEV